MNFSSFDLNLLRVFDAMSIEGNTRRAGERIGLSQPAVSAALARLRKALDDPLFVREGNQMVPTPRATELKQPIHDYLKTLEEILSAGQEFDPATTSRTFRIFGGDFFAELLLPKLMNRLAVTAPGIQVLITDCATDQFATGIAEGQFELALNPKSNIPEWMSAVRAFSTSFTIVTTQNNPAISAAGIQSGNVLPLDLVCSMPHVLFSPKAEPVGLLDDVLKPTGKSRTVAVSTPQLYGAAAIIAQTGFLGTLPTAFAKAVADRFDLATYSLPIEFPQIDIYLYWHHRYDANSAHRWMRDQMLNVLHDIDERQVPCNCITR